MRVTIMNVEALVEGKTAQEVVDMTKKVDSIDGQLLITTAMCSLKYKGDDLHLLQKELWNIKDHLLDNAD